MTDNPEVPDSRGVSPGTKLILSIVFLVAAFFTLNYLGFCYSRMRFVSDREKIEAAVRWTIEDATIVIPEKTDQGTTYRSVPIEKYPSIEEFLRRNPSCCRVGVTVGDDIPHASFPRRILGLVSDSVEVRFTATYVDNGVTKTLPVKRSWAVTACGRVVTHFSI